MTSVPVRQPRGPSINSFAAVSQGPPEPDTDSLRRSNSVTNPRHQPSASVSSTPASTSAFHGSRYRHASRFRSGSLSSGNNDPGLVRRGSGREAVPTEEVLVEDGAEDGPVDNGGWGKGLSRQSSLPSRRFANPVVNPSETLMPPPRPPRRDYGQTSPPSHAPSHSLSSLTMFSPPLPSTLSLDEPIQTGASISRTQSLRAQAKHNETSLARSSSLRAAAAGANAPGETQTVSTLGRSSSLRDSQEKHRASLGPFTPPTPPPVSSTAALPPFQFTNAGADVKRHQSLTTNFGRSRTRQEVTSAATAAAPRLDQAEPPTSPIGHSVWSPAAGANGWGNLPLQEAFEAMQLNRKPSNGLDAERLTAHVPNEEPSWVANLVGQAEPSRNWDQRQAINVRWDQPIPYQQFPPKTFAQLQPPPFIAYPSPPASAALQNHDLAVIELARSKGLNPATFNCRPSGARFFVIKSYTEDDVQKSLKHEIWSSTVLGNKRLDTAFRESGDHMPIYLFFSVNGSRHFCGVAQMLTPVDDKQTSTVWAEDKWKGIFRVKWIFVRDVPSAALRHIRLINTPEQKPITNSRDTQEIHYEAGCEVLQIFLDHQTKSKTSLLQDFAYYEQLSAQRDQSAVPYPPQTFIPQFQMPMAAPPVPPIPARFR